MLQTVTNATTTQVTMGRTDICLVQRAEAAGVLSFFTWFSPEYALLLPTVLYL